MADSEKVERVPSNPSDAGVGGVQEVRNEKNPYEINNVLLDEEAVERLAKAVRHEDIVNSV